MGENSEENGFFEGVLTIAGVISGAIFGSDNGGWVGLFIGAIILGAIGNRIGAAADWFVKLLALIVILLINSVTRRFIWEIIKVLFE